MPNPVKHARRVDRRLAELEDGAGELLVVEVGDDAVRVPFRQGPERRLRRRRVVKQPPLGMARVGANPQQGLPMKAGVLTHQQCNPSRPGHPSIIAAPASALEVVRTLRVRTLGGPGRASYVSPVRTRSVRTTLGVCGLLSDK